MNYVHGLAIHTALMNILEILWNALRDRITSRPGQTYTGGMMLGSTALWVDCLLGGLPAWWTPLTLLLLWRLVKTNFSSVLGTVPLSVLVARYWGLDRQTVCSSC